MGNIKIFFGTLLMIGTVLLVAPIYEVMAEETEPVNIVELEENDVNDLNTESENVLKDDCNNALEDKDESDIDESEREDEESLEESSASEMADGNQTTNLISYSTHVQNVGWQDSVYDGEMSGTSGQSLRLEAIKIEVNTTETGLNGGGNL